MVQKCRPRKETRRIALAVSTSYTAGGEREKKRESKVYIRMSAVSAVYTDVSYTL